MRRRPFTILAALSLALCVAMTTAVIASLVSPGAIRQIGWAESAAQPDGQRTTQGSVVVAHNLVAEGGKIGVVRWRVFFSTPPASPPPSDYGGCFGYCESDAGSGRHIVEQRWWVASLLLVPLILLTAALPFWWAIDWLSARRRASARGFEVLSKDRRRQ